MTLGSLWPNCVCDQLPPIPADFGDGTGPYSDGHVRGVVLAVSGNGFQHVAPVAVDDEGDGRGAVVAEV